MLGRWSSVGVGVLAAVGFAAACSSETASGPAPINATGGAAGAGASGGAAGSAAAGSGMGGSGLTDASVSLDGSPFDPDSGCATARSEATVERLPVDIIWVVDNSTSMEPAIDELTQGLNDFAGVITNTADLDYRIIMLSLRGQGLTNSRYGVCIPEPLAGANCADGDRYFQSSVDVRSVQPLEHVLGTLAQTSGYAMGESRGGEPWRDWLRPEATKSFVVVTDDNQRTDPAFGLDALENFAGPAANPFNSTTLGPGILTSEYGELFAGYQFNGLYGWGSETNASQPCSFPGGQEAAASGETYTHLVQKTGGVRAKICDGAAAWSGFFDSLATAVEVQSKIACELDIPAPATGELNPGLVNVQLSGGGADEPILKTQGGAAGCGTDGGWYYDDETSPTQVILCPTTCESANERFSQGGGAVDIVFGCATIVK